MATNGRRGADYERRVGKVLEGHGYIVVRSAGSHSPADLVAMKPGELVLVQCKLNGRLDPDEWNELRDMADATGGDPVLAQPGPRRRGTIFNRLTSRKDGRGRQPLGDWSPTD